VLIGCIFPIIEFLVVALHLNIIAGGSYQDRIAGEEFVMKTTKRENDVEPGMSLSSRLGVGSWSILIVLLLLLAVTFVIIYLGWTLANGTDVPTSGYVAMAFGVIVSLAVGFGLMALIFYSNRKGYDEPPVLMAPDGDGNESDESKK
jgi:NADH:ubiquinone oxidoreductase subunit K